MADRLILSLEAHSPSFACFSTPLLVNRISRKPTGGISLVGPKLRLSAQLLLANSSSPYSSSSLSSSDSVPPNFDLLSKTELSDGSHLFRFGDPSEVERNLGAGETSSKSIGVEEEIISDDIMDSENGARDLETSEGRRDNKSHLKREKPIRTADIVSKVNVASTNHSNVIKIKERESGLSFQKEKETVNLASESEHSDGIGEENASASELNSKHSNEASVLISTVDSKKVEVDVAEEKVSFSVESENTSESGTATELSSSELCSEVEISEAHELPEGADDKISIGTKQVSPIGQGDSFEAMTKLDADNNCLAEQTGRPTLPDVKPVLVVGATYDTVGESAETYTAGRSDTVMESMDVDSLPSPTTKQKIVDGIIASDDTAQVSAANIMELELFQKASRSDEISTKGFFLDSGVALLQHPSQELAGREDAYFIACQSWLGVADGVREWSLQGTKPGVYSQEFLSNCQKIVSDDRSVRITDPVEVLTLGAAETQSHGSSTILVAYFDGQALLVANIGDSGFMVIRKGTVLQRSSPMFNEFNFPLQIKPGDDPSKLAEVYHVDLDEGDVIIAATDGLFDNIYDQEIALIISNSLEQNMECQEIADLLASRAQKIGALGCARTPFSDAAQAAGYVGYRGGKLDAVTVITSVVRKREAVMSL